MSIGAAVFLLAIGLSSEGQASDPEKGQLLANPGHEIIFNGTSFRFFALTVQPKIATDLDKMISRIQPVFFRFILPSKVVISLRDNALEGADSTGHMTYNPVWLKNSVDVEPVFVHEYAHLVFSHLANLRTVLPSSDNFIRYVEEQIGMRARMEDLPRSNVEALKVLNKEARFLDFANEENAIRILTKPYNEFFADLAACVVADDPDAMATVEKDVLRSFRPGNAIPNTYSADLDPHVFFLSSRQLAWSKFVAQDLSMAAAQRILRIVYDTAWTEIRTRASDPRLMILSKPEIDLRFFEALQKAL